VTPHDEPSEPPRSSTTRLGIGYATGLTFAHLLTAAEVLAAEARRWTAHGSVALRGRSEATQVSVPHEVGDHNGDHDDR
jgi:hypothetical protein